MKLENGRVIFSSYSQYNSLVIWLKKKNKRIIRNQEHELVPNGSGIALALKVEDIPKKPPRPKACSIFTISNSNIINNIVSIDFNKN